MVRELFECPVRLAGLFCVGAAQRGAGRRHSTGHVANATRRNDITRSGAASESAYVTLRRPADERGVGRRYGARIDHVLATAASGPVGRVALPEFARG